MKQKIQKVNSKLLLFGEYTILLNAPALAIPYIGLSGYLDFSDTGINQKSEESNFVIRKFYDFIIDETLSKFFQLESLKNDIEKGLFFNSNIPQGYGLGSSGALCAAITRDYGSQKIKEISNSELKQFFSKLESYFHGKSSGIDPLVVYHNSPLYFEEDTIEKVDITMDIMKSNNLSVFLLDTLTTGDTAPLVRWFTEQLSTEQYRNMLYEKYIPLLKSVIKSFLDFDNDYFKMGIKEISKLQHKIFSRMIPNEILTIWEEGNASDNYYLKLCGSGGGGYMLGFTYLNKKQICSVLCNKNIKLTYII